VRRQAQWVVIGQVVVAVGGALICYLTQGELSAISAFIGGGIGAAATLPGFGARHMSAMRSYPNLAVLTAMVHDETSGEVLAGEDVGSVFWTDLDPDAAFNEAWRRPPIGASRSARSRCSQQPG